jgi:hypothetical protein
MTQLKPPLEPPITDEQGKEIVHKILKEAYKWVCDSIKTIPNDRWNKDVMLTYNRILAVLNYMGEKPGSKVEDWEVSFMELLHDRKYSIRDIAYVIPRSTSTIHKYIK